MSASPEAEELFDDANGDLALGELDAAVEKYRAALELNPDHAGIRVNYAVVLLRLGQWERGIEHLRMAVRQDPTNETFRKALADAVAQAPPSLGSAK